MNARDLFKKAKAQADALPGIVATQELKSAVMLATVATWVHQLDFVSKLDDGARAISILAQANEAIVLINKYLNQEAAQ